MNMNDVQTLYSTMCDIIDDFLLLSAELKELTTLMNLLSELLDEEGFTNNPTVASLRSATLYIGRVSTDFYKLDDPANDLIRQFHDYLVSSNSAVQKGT